MSHFKKNNNKIIINNIQNFLSKFQKVSELDLYYESIKDALTKECQLPDLYIKTRTPFDRNKIFVWNENKKKETYKYKINSKKQESNYFPM
jgi:hypothetical protein